VPSPDGVSRWFYTARPPQCILQTIWQFRGRASGAKNLSIDSAYTEWADFTGGLVPTF